MLTDMLGISHDQSGIVLGTSQPSTNNSIQLGVITQDSSSAFSYLLTFASKNIPNPVN